MRPLTIQFNDDLFSKIEEEKRNNNDKAIAKTINRIINEYFNAQQVKEYNDDFNSRLEGIEKNVEELKRNSKLIKKQSYNAARTAFAILYMFLIYYDAYNNEIKDDKKRNMNSLMLDFIDDYTISKQWEIVQNIGEEFATSDTPKNFFQGFRYLRKQMPGENISLASLILFGDEKKEREYLGRSNV